MVTSTTVATQRSTVQAMVNAAPVTPMCPSIPEPMEEPKTISAAAPPIATVAAISGKA